MRCSGVCSFNRTIEELKQQDLIFFQYQLVTFNRTIEELKRRLYHTLKRVENSFNRTIEELKRINIRILRIKNLIQSHHRGIETYDHEETDMKTFSFNRTIEELKLVNGCFTAFLYRHSIAP